MSGYLHQHVSIYIQHITKYINVLRQHKIFKLWQGDRAVETATAITEFSQIKQKIKSCHYRNRIRMMLTWPFGDILKLLMHYLDKIELLEKDCSYWTEDKDVVFEIREMSIVLTLTLWESPLYNVE